MLLFVLLAATMPGGSRKCPFCIGSADPESRPVGVDVLRAQAAPPRGRVIAEQEPPPAPPKPKPRKEPQQRFQVLMGGEYWYRAETSAEKVIETVKVIKPDLIHASVWGPELLGGVHTNGQVVGVTYIRPNDLGTVRRYRDYWKKVIDEAHKAGAKVQSTFSLTFSFDRRTRDAGFFKYYNDLWETDILGPKPVANPIELLNRDRDGNPIVGPSNHMKDVFGYQGCPNNPYWRQLLKQMVKAGIAMGFDGFMVQFSYRYDCQCRYCLRGFRQFLAANYGQRALADRMGIGEIATAFLDTTRGQSAGLAPPSAVAGHRLGPLDMAAHQFTHESVRSALNEVFLQYGRSLKPDLIVSTWMHHRNFLIPGVDYSQAGYNLADERALLPPDQWGRGEDYLWYCLGGVTSHLRQHDAGDASLTAKLLYNMGSGKPFVLSKYDDARPRLWLSESWAHRGLGLALDETKWPPRNRAAVRNAVLPYYSFIHRYANLYHPSEPYTEFALLLPRRGFYQNDSSFLQTFDQYGHSLLEDHRLFDVITDQNLAKTDLSRYRAVILPSMAYLSPAERKQLNAFRESGGSLVLPGVADAPPVADRILLSKSAPDLAALLRERITSPLSGCDAPWTLQMTTWHQPAARRLIVHLVNYDRDEDAAGVENPRPVAPVPVALNLPPGKRSTRVWFVTPERPEPQSLEASAGGGQIHFRAPGFDVYGVAVVEYE